jgi:hypothetical protein
MKNIEVDIWLNQFISFFDKNPNELKQLIGNIDKELFFSKVKERCIKNIEEGDEVSLTQKQLIEILVSLNKNNNQEINVKNLDKLFEKTKFGSFCLN